MWQLLALVGWRTAALQILTRRWRGSAGESVPVPQSSDGLAWRAAKKKMELAACKSLADYLLTAFLTNFDQCAACLGLSGCQKTFIFIVCARERRERVVQASKLL